MKIKKITLAMLLLCFALFLVLNVGAIERSACVSTGLDILAARTEMVKAGLVNNDIAFDAEDFERNLNVSALSSVTVTSLPSRADGVLYLGNGEVSVGQTISRENLGYLNFVFVNEEIRDSRFCFTSNLGDYEISCKMCLVDTINRAPIVSFDTKKSISVCTYRDVAVYGELEATDADGDDFFFEIVAYPKNGTLTMEDASGGVYRYFPLNGYCGEDSFRYVAVDRYGNYSAAAEVSLKVDMQKNRLVYADMNNSISHAPAIALTERGIMSAATIGDKSYFYPSKTVSRLDFLVAAMKAIGLEDVEDCSSTVFDDDESIPEGLRGYVSLAQQKNYICGRIDREGRLLLSPDDDITRAEAAVILARMLAKPLPDATPVFADGADVPAWARDAVYTLAELGVMDVRNGYVEASATLNREQAAYMLYMLESVSE
ncbi:MAG: S-layer homology domain-containing protein [Clostridia bacterium]|nr:S-layer homology domain-containing protein [Clostridia bacterium]